MTNWSDTISDAFNNRSVIPVDLSEAGKFISFNSLCKLILEGNTDVLFLGDTNHKDLELQKSFMNEEFIKLMQEAGANTYFLEVHELDVQKVKNYHQSIDDALQQTNDDELRKTLKHYIPGSTHEFIGKLMEYGIEPIGIDHETHTEKQINNDHLTYIRRMLNDLPMSKKIEQIILEGEGKIKAVMQYGSMHGSQIGDGILEQGTIDLVKVDCYRSREDCIEAYERAAKSNVAYNKLMEELDIDIEFSFYQDFPQMIYLMDSQEVFVTNKTSDLLTEKVMNFETNLEEIPVNPTTPNISPKH